MSENAASQVEVIADISDPILWLVTQAKPEMRWVLAHTDEGVVWGVIEKDALQTSSKLFAGVEAQLQTPTLQQVRLFGPAGEIFVWRETETSFRARRIMDGATSSLNCIEDRQWLWGTPIGEINAAGDNVLVQNADFMLLHEGKQGLRHAPPVGHLGLTANDRVMLTVRHYIQTDLQTTATGQTLGTGVAYFADSRLVDLCRAEN